MKGPCGVQTFEVLSAHPVVPSSCLSSDDKFKSLHLCEASGAMVFSETLHPAL